MTCPLGADTTSVIMYVLIATVIFASSLSAAYDICPLGTEEIIHDAFGLSTSKAHVQSGLCHRIPCPSFREGDSIVGVIWYKGNSLDNSSRKRLISHSNGDVYPSSDRYATSSSSSLVIKGVRDSDEGKYLCNVKTRDTGNREGEIVLKVLGGSFSARTKYTSSTAGLKREGRQNLRCQCASVTPNAISVVYWSMGEGITEDTEIIGARFADGATLQFQDDVDYSIDSDGTLTVNSVGALHDAARFWCHVFQSDGSQTDCYIDVHVSGETPLFGPLRASEASFYMLKGRRQIIPCTAWTPGNATCLVQWFKFDLSSHHVLINYTVSSSTVHADPSFELALDFGLVIKSVDEDDAGNYSCSANPEANEGLVQVRVIGDTFPLDGRSATKGDVIAFESDSKLTLRCPAMEGVPIGSRTTLIWSFGAVDAQLTTVVGKLDLPAGSKWLSDIDGHTCFGLTIEGSLLLTNCSQNSAVRFWCHVFPHVEALRRSYVDVVMRDSIKPSNIGLIAALVSMFVLVVVAITVCLMWKLRKRNPPHDRERVVYHPIPKAEPARQFSVTTLATMIREFVSETMNRLPITPWVTGDDSYAAMDDIYTPLEMYLNVYIAGCKARYRIESESEIFDDGICELSSCHVLLEGRSGCGKTAFLSKMASDWSMKKSHAVLGKKKMVIVLPAKILLKARNVGRTVVQYMLKGGTKHWANSINEYCLTHPDEVAILVDGCNDTNDIDNVMEIMTEQGLLGCQIVISARHTQVVEETSKRHKLRHITITGFTQESAKAYVESHCDAFSRNSTKYHTQTRGSHGETQEHKEQDDTELQSHCDKSDNSCENQNRRWHPLIHSYLDANILHPKVASLPVIITTLCQLSLWTDGVAFQKDQNMGDLLIWLVKCLFERSSDKGDDDTRTHEALNKHVEFDDVTGLSKVQLDILEKLGEVILPKMNECQATFSKAHFVNSCDNGQAILDVSIKIGLVRCEGDTDVYFVLEILRDFCAGLSLAHTAEQDENWMAELQHTDLMSAAETLSNVFAFACRKSQTVCSGLVQKIADCKDKETTNVIGMQTMIQLCLLLNFEGNCKGLLNAKFAGLFEGGIVRLGGVSGHTIRMLSYLFEHANKSAEGVALEVESVELLRLDEKGDWEEFREYFEYFLPLNLEEDIQETEELQRCSENGTLTKLRERVESRNKYMPQFSPDQSDIRVLRTVQLLGLYELLECQAGELHKQGAKETFPASKPDQTAQSKTPPLGIQGSGSGIQGSVSKTNFRSGECHQTSASGNLVGCLSYLPKLENLVLLGTILSSKDICNLARKPENVSKLKKLDLRLNKQFEDDAFSAVAESLHQRFRRNVSWLTDLRLSLYNVTSKGFSSVLKNSGEDGAGAWSHIETLCLLHGEIPKAFCDFLKQNVKKKIPLSITQDRKPYTEILFSKGMHMLKPPFCGLHKVE